MYTLGRVAKLIISIITFDFVFNDSRIERKKWVSTLTLPHCNSLMKFTDKRPIKISGYNQYLTFNEAYDLLERYGWVTSNEYGYYVGDIHGLEWKLWQQIKSGDLKLPEDLMMYKCNVNSDA